MEQGAYGSRLGSAFRMADARSLTTRSLLKSTLALTELRCGQPNFGRSDPVACEDAYLVVLHVQACSESLYFDRRLTRRESHSAGSVSIYDLRRSPFTDIHDPYHSLVFYLPSAALHTVSSEAGVQRVGDLRHGFGTSVDDPVTRHLLSSLFHVLERGHEAPSLFVDHVALALTAHLACAYGGLNPAAGQPRSGLAPWQERRAKELMCDCLHEEIALSRVAAECGLSVRHFSRAFRLSTGVPPHRWLLKQRVERAKDLLRTRALSLADVAGFCGFADQSHFTRVFTTAVGVTPSLWRRESANSAENAKCKN